MSDAATIFALSSGALPSGIAVVRVSGPQAFATLSTIAGAVPAARVATLRTLRDSPDIIDHALVLAFPAPGSSTGEDVAEFHVHGGRAVVAALLSCLTRQPGLRPAEAGEFTRRAFDNGRLDLTQAEGLADLVEAETEAQRRAALSQSDGALRNRVEGWRSTIIDLLADAQARLDFSEEDDVAGHEQASGPLQTLIADLEASLADRGRTRSLREGLTIVVSGPPNVGKSSLVNALARRDIAIVSPLPGTTRDAIETRLDLGGVLVTLVDTAGLRETADPVEAEGVARARGRAADADLVLNLWCEGPEPLGGLAVRTKADLGGLSVALTVSSLTGLGIAALVDHLASWARTTVRPEEPPLLTQERHYAACRLAVAALHEAAATSDEVLRAESLRAAAAELGSITGAVGVEEVLDRIFSRFCIGK